jgi:RNA polymerase sigma-70 factor (ECF subfamily)
MAEIMQDSSNYSDSGPGPGNPGSTSSSLLERVKAGDPEGWRRLVYLYTPLVLAWCRRTGLRTQDAEDVAQEVLKTIATKFATFTEAEQPGSFRRWLYSITRNKLGDAYRRQRAEPPAAGGSDAQDVLAQLPADPSETSDDAEDPSERALLCRRAMELVRAEFEPQTWEAAWRLAVEGHCPADVAADLGVSVSTVYSAKSRVLRRLREELKGLGIEVDTQS